MLKRWAATEERTFYHRAVENAQVISQKKDAKPIGVLGIYINCQIYIYYLKNCEFFIKLF